MADKEIITLPGTRIQTLNAVVERGKNEDGTLYEKQQAVAPRTLEKAITDDDGVALTVKLAGKADEIIYNEETEKLELRANGEVISETEIPAGGGTMYATINVTTAETELFGQPVTCSIAGGETLQSNFSSTGAVTFKAKFVGQYEIVCGDASDTVNVTTLGAIYSVELFLAAKILASTPDVELYGKVVKLTDGNGEEQSATLDENGKHTFQTRYIGVHTVSCEGHEVEVTVEALGASYNVELYAIYSFIDHMDVLDPAQKIEYTGMIKDYTPMVMNMDTHIMDYGSFGNCFVLKENKPAMVLYDGTVDYWLDPNDYSKKADGTPSDVADINYGGNAFAWLPRVYKKEYQDGDDRYVFMSKHKIDGSYLPNGFIDPDNNVLEGVWLPMFYAMNGTGGQGRSMVGGKPMVDKDTATQKAAIDKNGDRYVFLGGPIMCTIADLLIMFAKTTNTQAAYGYGASSAYVNNSSINYGVLSNTVVPGGQFYGSADGKSLNKAFHSIALVSWNVWLRDPYTLNVSGTYKVSKNYKYDITGATYDDAGSVSGTTSSFIKKLKVVEGYGFLPVETGASDSTGYCDKFWANTSITSPALRFGSLTGGTADGLFALQPNNAPSLSDYATSFAFLLLPQAQETEQEEAS